MGGKKKSKAGKGGSQGKDADHRCGGCKNFDADKKGGYCRYRDKKRSADDKACGHFNARRG